MRMHASLVLYTGHVLGFVLDCTDYLDLTLRTVLGFHFVHCHAMVALVAIACAALYVVFFPQHAADASKALVYLV